MYHVYSRVMCTAYLLYSEGWNGCHVVERVVLIGPPRTNVSRREDGVDAFYDGQRWIAKVADDSILYQVDLSGRLALRNGPRPAMDMLFLPNSRTDLRVPSTLLTEHLLQSHC